MKNILIVAMTNVSSDPRVLRQVSTLKELYRIDLVGFGDPIDGVENFHRISRVTAPFRGITRKFLKILLLFFRRFKSYYFIDLGIDASAQYAFQGYKYDLILANDFESLPFIATFDRSKVPILLDAHEYYFDEINARIRKRALRPFRNWVSSSSIDRVVGMTTVCSGISELYKRDFDFMEIPLVRNIPERTKVAFESHLSDRIELIHHGAAVQGRGLIELIELTPLLEKRFTLNLMLVPTDIEFYKHLRRLAHEYNSRVKFLNPVPTREIVSAISSFDLGIHLIPPNSINNVYALPNKFFEFMHANLGVLVGPSPEMEKIVKDFSIGVVSKTFLLSDVAKELNALDRETVEIFRKNSHQASKEFDGESESKVLRATVAKSFG